MECAFIQELESRRLLSGYSFHDLGAFSDGVADQIGTIVRDSSGDLFGIAESVGTVGNENSNGCIYELPAGSSKPIVVMQFSGTGNAGPGGLTIDSNGDLFGTLSEAGDAQRDGIVFELPKGASSITTVAEFSGATTGSSPFPCIVTDAEGNLYGVTVGGTIWEYNLSNQSLTALADFPNTAGSGSTPNGIGIDSTGNIFASKSSTGLTGGYGSIWELPSGSSTIQQLASFNQSNGDNPVGQLVVDSSGDVFGTTSAGGAFSAPMSSASGFGTVFEVSKGSGTITDIASFNGTDGSFPVAGLAMDTAGDLFGTAMTGGTDVSSSFSDGAGTVFEVANGTNTIQPIVAFNATDGYFPKGILTIDSSGTLYGATDVSIFKLTPNGGTQTGGNLSAALTATAPANAVSGQPIKANFAATISNGGSGLLSESDGTQLFLSSDGSVDSSSVNVTAEVSKKIKLKAGAHTHFAFHIKTIPAGTLPGTYQWIEQITEPGGNMVDAVASSQVNVATPEINLTGSFTKFNSTARAARPFTEIISVSNLLGNVTATGTLPIEVETSPGFNQSGATPLVTINRRIKIAAGKSTKISLSLTIPTTGSDVLFVELDPLDTLPYDTSTNNVFASAAAVTVG